ncbi:hypothetical protein B0J12DRAFT_790282 [Macrophomina phaseolina]|uniref:Ribonucleases P/MRP subunit Pop8-like domain-containing protein n=1 Tax=Macrophomina phaseolina TaxID=35725 RepID=A0ABQ8FTS1_9PEZI|nr:hypothetical protein B0J12DRAFT_790282 [Macrophomina phaseolina]
MPPHPLPLSRPLTNLPGATTSFTSTASTTSSTAAQTLATHTLRHNRWAYIHLSLHANAASTASPALDALTLRQHLTAALAQHLGQHGAATPVDVLKISDNDAWIRVPSEDGAGVVAAIGAWVGLSGLPSAGRGAGAGGGDGELERSRIGMVVRGWGEWLGAVSGAMGGDGGRDVFVG